MKIQKSLNIINQDNKKDNNIMENGRSEVIINKLIDMIENGQNVPLAAGKVMVNKDETILMLKELESIVEGELKVYREVNDRKGKIINDAKKEAEEIIYEALQSASRIRITKHVSSVGSGFRPDDLNKDEKAALRTAGDIYASSLIYTDEMLTEVTDVIAQAYDIINNQYGRMVATLEEKAKLISDNKAELMASLKELSKEERYTQILDLSQLLSHELYMEREKARELEKNGSYQMEMQLEKDVPDSAFINTGDIKESDISADNNSVVDDEIRKIKTVSSDRTDAITVIEDI